VSFPTSPDGSSTPRPSVRSAGPVIIWLIAVSCGLAGCGGDVVAIALQDLRSADVAVRRRAVQTLFEARPADPMVVTALADALSDADGEVRRAAARTLGVLGTPARDVIPRLEQTLRDSDTGVRRAAAFALQQLAPESEAYRQELIAAMRAGDGGVIVALPKLSPRPDWALEPLRELLKDRRPGTRRLAIEALAELRFDDPTLRPALQRLAESDRDDRVREAAREALSRLK
jgi:HEAT repeat protein